MLRAAEEAETEACTEGQLVDFKKQSESAQAWIREKKQKLLSLGVHIPFEERIQIAQVGLDFMSD